MTTVIGRWWPSIVVVLGAVAVLIASSGPVSIVIAVLLIGYALMISPAFFPRSAELEGALEQAKAGRAPLVFWKPGCIYCIRLRIAVGRTGRRMSWIDSSVDEGAEAIVRSKNGGDHTTPTVMFEDQTRTNPDAGWVRALQH